ncbi:hypothetical protein HY620_03675 [Candidatus Uhrbacteria bacterium]|nr:hypothetical protein [Candidatus Uhrbacteria bacterium]
MFTIIILLVLFVILGTFAYAGYSAAPWLPMRKYDIERFCQFANIRPGERFYDLGCGDGRIVCAVAQRGAQSTGYEISILPYLLAKLRCFLQGIPLSSIQYRNLWTSNLSNADTVFFYLLPQMQARLKEKLEKELKEGARVITYAWPIEGWQPINVDEKPDKLKLYLYRMLDSRLHGNDIVDLSTNMIQENR